MNQHLIFHFGNPCAQFIFEHLLDPHLWNLMLTTVLQSSQCLENRTYHYQQYRNHHLISIMDETGLSCYFDQVSKGHTILSKNPHDPSIFSYVRNRTFIPISMSTQDQLTDVLTVREIHCVFPTGIFIFNENHELMFMTDDLNYQPWDLFEKLFRYQFEHVSLQTSFFKRAMQTQWAI